MKWGEHHHPRQRLDRLGTRRPRHARHGDSRPFWMLIGLVGLMFLAAYLLYLTG